MPSRTATATVMPPTPPFKVSLEATKQTRSKANASRPTHTRRPSSTSTTLRTLYPRATRAFITRNYSLVLSLLSSAFALLQSPSAPVDELSTSRLKWDILRITLETTLYCDPPQSPITPTSSSAHDESILQLAPVSFLATQHTRSLRLFTPATATATPNAAHLPPQVIYTLAMGALKLEVPNVGRGIIEDWLAVWTGTLDSGQESEAGMEKVLEVYCLHVLPRLDEWERAKDVLKDGWEGAVLSSEKRDHLLHLLESLHSRHLASPSPSTSFPSHPPSPAPSTVSTSSAHTIVPLTSILPSPSRSRGTSVSSATAKPTPKRPKSAVSTPKPFPTPPSAPPEPTASASAVTRPSNAAVLRSWAKPYLLYISRHSTHWLLLVMLVMSMILRRVYSRRRGKMTGGVADARRRLGVSSGWWEASVRAVKDTLRMAAGGMT